MEDTTIDDVLKTFENFYKNKDFQKALQTLESHPSSMSSGPWHYNMGLVNARLENWPLARFHFLSAQRSGLSTAEVLQNQNLVQEKLDVKNLEKSLNVTDYFFKGTKFLSNGEFVTLSLLILVIGIISLKKNLSLKRFGLVVFMSLLPTCFGLMINSWPESIVLKDSKIQQGPSGIFDDIVDIPAGVKIITEGDGEWRQVIYPSRFKGWIKKGVLKELE